MATDGDIDSDGSARGDSAAALVLSDSMVVFVFSVNVTIQFRPSDTILRNTHNNTK